MPEFAIDKLTPLQAAAAGVAVGGLAAYMLLKSTKTVVGAVRSVTASGSTVYESSRAVDEYLQFHFAPADQLAPLVGSFVNESALDFPRLCASACTKHAKSKGRALDVGCAVGRHTFELARDFDEVLGFDYSKAFIDAANKLKSLDKLQYECTVESKIKDTRTASVPAGIDKRRCTFVWGDACNMKGLGDIGEFDAVLAANLLCRLPDPHKFLKDIARYVKPGGVFVLVSPYSWLEEYTKLASWVGGYCDGAGRAVMTAERVKTLLGAEFEVEGDSNMPFLIREHQRKYQLGCSNCLVLRRKGGTNLKKVVA